MIPGGPWAPGAPQAGAGGYPVSPPDRRAALVGGPGWGDRARQPGSVGSGASGGLAGGWGAFGGYAGTSGAFWGRNCTGGTGIGTPGTAGAAEAAASTGRGSGVNQGSLAMSLKAANVSGDDVTRQS